MTAYLLFSGGLDSLLAAKVLQAQGIKVIGVTFVSNFFTSNQAIESAKQIGLELKIIDISQAMLDLVKNPKNGRGKNLNPCLDCHAFMVKQVKQKLLNKNKSKSFIATGEVLGQRPFSQTKQALEKIQILAGTEILRPLSAKLLPLTSMEEQGMVNRDKLLDIQGRTRAKQKELALKHGLKTYPSPAGGCLLTESEFCKKLSQMMAKWPHYDPEDVELLKSGRIFWANYDNQSWVLIVVARKKQEAEKLVKLAKTDDLLAELVKTTGPLTLARGLPKKELDKTDWEFEVYIPEEWPHSLLAPPQRSDQILDTIALLTGYYKPLARKGKAKVKIKLN